MIQVIDIHAFFKLSRGQYGEVTCSRCFQLIQAEYQGEKQGEEVIAYQSNVLSCCILLATFKDALKCLEIA